MRIRSECCRALPCVQDYSHEPSMLMCSCCCGELSQLEQFSEHEPVIGDMVETRTMRGPLRVDSARLSVTASGEVIFNLAFRNVIYMDYPSRMTVVEASSDE